nr:hypothetical protein CFP56_18964 [Quercus suber]
MSFSCVKKATPTNPANGPRHRRATPTNPGADSPNPRRTPGADEQPTNPGADSPNPDLGADEPQAPIHQTPTNPGADFTRPRRTQQHRRQSTKNTLSGGESAKHEVRFGFDFFWGSSGCEVG